MAMPSFNLNCEQSLRSMEKVAAVIEKNKAQLRINHDKTQSNTIPKAPMSVD